MPRPRWAVRLSDFWLARTGGSARDAAGRVSSALASARYPRVSSRFPRRARSFPGPGLIPETDHPTPSGSLECGDP
eukprot:767292-Hanusia_phi.AAC.3